MTTVRFNGKKVQNKFIRPIPNAWVKRTVVTVPESQQTAYETEEDENEKKQTRQASPRKSKKKNTENDMADNRIAQVQQVLDVNQLPKRQTRIEKKDKGLYERAENDVTLITEDNKMILTD